MNDELELVDLGDATVETKAKGIIVFDNAGEPELRPLDG